MSWLLRLTQTSSILGDTLKLQRGPLMLTQSPIIRLDSLLYLNVHEIERFGIPTIAISSGIPIRISEPQACSKDATACFHHSFPQVLGQRNHGVREWPLAYETNRLDGLFQPARANDDTVVLSKRRMVSRFSKLVPSLFQRIPLSVTYAIHLYATSVELSP